MAKVRNELEDEHRAAHERFMRSLDEAKKREAETRTRREANAKRREMILAKLGITEEELRILLDA